MPVYLSSGVYTTPEYVRKRFGGRRCNIYLAVQNLIMFVLTKLSVSNSVLYFHDRTAVKSDAEIDLLNF